MKKNNPYKKYAIIGTATIVTLAMILLFSKIIIYLVICAFTAFLVYIRYSLQLPFKIEPYLFLSVIISLSYGIWFTVFFVAVSMLIPKIIGGGEVDATTILYLISFVFMNMACILLQSIGIKILGVVISIVDFVIITALGAAMRPDKIISGMLIVGVNIFLFVKLGEPLLTLINTGLI